MWDSADMLERLLASLDAQGRNFFNNNSTANTRDSRSDDKGVEPESVVVGEVNGRPYALSGSKGTVASSCWTYRTLRRRRS